MFYECIKVINNPEAINILVNKSNKLPDNFIPNDLELINAKYTIKPIYLKKEAKEAFEKLCKDAEKEGYKILGASGYRSYSYQKQLYYNYITEKGLEYADSCSARPGHSEHQTGLAIDVEGSNGTYDDFLNTKEFAWMKQSAYKYGFILRYPDGKSHITGFKYEPWHYRYVGINDATKINDLNITYEEYKNDRA